jgi:hypothetical protein
MTYCEMLLRKEQGDLSSRHRAVPWAWFSNFQSYGGRRSKAATKKNFNPVYIFSTFSNHIQSAIGDADLQLAVYREQRSTSHPGYCRWLGLFLLKSRGVSAVE